MSIAQYLIQPQSSVLEAIAAIDANRRGVALVVDGRNHLLGVVTDGDVRRAILAGLDLRLPVTELLERRARHLYPTPISAPADLGAAEHLLLMRRHQIRHLPLVDEGGAVVDLALLDDLISGSPPGLTAVVMAGGFGKRLRPLTEDLPKPMLPLGGRPLMERLIEQLRAAEIHRVHVTTHYKGERIVEHFGDGASFGVEINYVQESQPLGTAGALSLLPEQDEPLLVINGDILTRVDFAALFAFHGEHQADLTVGVREIQSQVPYGVVELDGVEITRVVEKPTQRYFISAGIYLLAPRALRAIPRDGRRFDMPDLINLLIGQGCRVVSFPIREYWLDIGHMEHYAQAQADAAQGRI